ncbi:putative 3-oxoacyl-(acyl-carrier-protein) synthase III [uncultured Desulfatiglans sp.]|uniref:Putative 3-oxoacyl-(Acyl-carrier-protein) synthase III n=1 Tax=Uncultured Desulfatiglans sp. TaxID=1748965 RepID=A0A653AI27_UNCDX|nr:putative 3-oxoacyl-(acyl-carrier-protein) synthase III [uncultured Desulfatiglans sp.]
MQGRNVYITGIGSFSPGNPVPFDEIEEVLGPLTDGPPKLMKRLDRMRKVMRELLGIEYSYYAIDRKTREATETNVSMSVKAAQKALQMAGIEAVDVDLIIYAGILYDYLCPPPSVLVQDALKIPRCAEMSIYSNCTSIYKALQVGSDLIANGRYQNALLVTSQMSSAFLKAEIFNQKVMTEQQVVLRWFLSDGAGALVLTAEKNTRPSLEVVDTYLESVGMGHKPPMRHMMGAINFHPLQVYEKGWHHLEQDLMTVSKLAPALGEKGFKRMIDQTGLNVGDVKCFFVNIPTKHLMDLTINYLRKHWGVDLPFYTKLSTRGYQGAPAIIIALDDYFQTEDLQIGDTLVSFVTESSKWMHAGFILKYC